MSRLAVLLLALPLALAACADDAALSYGAAYPPYPAYAYYDVPPYYYGPYADFGFGFDHFHHGFHHFHHGFHHFRGVHGPHGYHR